MSAPFILKLSKDERKFFYSRDIASVIDGDESFKEGCSCADGSVPAPRRRVACS